MNQQKRLHLVDQLLSAYPDANCELTYHTPYQLLVATVLSAQSTDKRVNIVTEKLFQKYPNPEDILRLGEVELAKAIRSIGFYKTKAKHIIGLTHKILDEFDGNVPDTLKELMSLPGVGRKTANVIRSTIFHIPAIAVDTHVFRLANRLELSTKDSVDQVEQDLMKRIPKKYWIHLHHALIWHGRRVCTARKPRCNQCILRNECPYYQKKGK